MHRDLRITILVAELDIILWSLPIEGSINLLDFTFCILCLHSVHPSMSNSLMGCFNLLLGKLPLNGLISLPINSDIEDTGVCISNRFRDF